MTIVELERDVAETLLRSAQGLAEANAPDEAKLAVEAYSSLVYAAAWRQREGVLQS